MGPEITVLIASFIGVLVSGYLLIDAELDRRSILRLPKEEREQANLDSFTRNRGIAESIRFIVLLIWLYSAIVAIAGEGVIRETIIWALVAIPVLITAGSIHSWWAKRRMTIEKGLELRNGSSK